MARRAKKASKEATNKPHIHPYMKGLFSCVTAAAVGRGVTPEAAYHDWKAAHFRAEQEDQGDYFFGKKA
jgi:hypothetical protein